jgi:methylated-DNA-[protein]-cysteine S-methyltransferase
MTYFDSMDSPIGPLRPVVDAEGRVLRIAFASETVDGSIHDAWRVAHVVTQLGEYFAGRRKAFELELAPVGSEFQHKIWALLVGIPFGETRSYGQLAKVIGEPNASRAVGRANATNPIPIVVPCHRVIGASGTLTGYAGGLEAKRILLDLERPALF